MFEDKLNLYREEINKALRELLKRLNNKDCSIICDAMEYSLLEGGKLLRPVLTLCVCDMFKKDFKMALPFACAVEFIHVGSLVHDDLPCMDDDEKRRGKASCHIKFNEAAAVLAGDSLFCSSFEVLTYAKEYGLKDEEILKAVSFLAEMFGTKGILAGQDMDMFLNIEDFKKDAKKTVKKIAKYKTASLIKAACRLGAIAAKASLEEIEILDRFADYFGVCFQIKDDILDFKQAEKKEEEKLDFIHIFGLEKANDLAVEYTEKALECLKKLDGSEFLVELTKKALYRKN